MSDSLPLGKFTFELLESRRMLSAALIATNGRADMINFDPGFISVDPGEIVDLPPIKDIPESISVNWDDASTIIASDTTSVSGPVSTFSSNLAGGADQYTVTIDWGDDTTSLGQVVKQGDGTFAVFGTHDYGTKGDFDVSIEIDAADGSMAWDYHRVFTDAGPLMVTSEPSVFGYTSDSGDDTYIASFFDSQGALDESAYTVTINWGDGTSSVGQVVAAGDGTYDVIGSHQYTTPGSFEMGITVARAGASVAATGTADVWDDSSTDDGFDSGVFVDFNSSTELLASQTTKIEGVVSQFTGDLTADQYTATIDWGDGTTTAGKVVRQDDGSYAVVGSHDYGAKGQYDVWVEVDSTDGSSGDFDYRSVFTQADPMFFTVDPSVWTNISDSPQDLYIGSFMDQTGSNDPSDYKVMIDWGDGTTSAGTVSASDGSLDIYGTHTYASATENFTMSVSIVRSDGLTISSSGSGEVVDWHDPIAWYDDGYGEELGGICYAMTGSSTDASTAATGDLTAFTVDQSAPDATSTLAQAPAQPAAVRAGAAATVTSDVLRTGHKDTAAFELASSSEPLI